LDPIWHGDEPQVLITVAKATFCLDSIHELALSKIVSDGFPLKFF